MKRILLVVPCYNCARQAERVARSIDQFLLHYSSTVFQIVNVLFIDNLSNDGTPQTLTSLFPLLKNSDLFRMEINAQNIGLGGTQKKAIQLLKDEAYDFLVVLHGDDQAAIDDLETLLSLSIENQFCTVLGSRFMNTQLLHNYSLWRTLGNRTLNFIYSCLLQKKIHDLGSGLNLFAKKDFSETAIFHTFDNGFTFNMDLIIFLSENKSMLHFAPIKWKSVDEKSNASAIRVGYKTLLKILLWKLQHTQR